MIERDPLGDDEGGRGVVTPTNFDAVAREWERIRKAAPGTSVATVESWLSDVKRKHDLPYWEDADLTLTARAFVDPKWGRKHPIAALGLAWRYRSEKKLSATLKFLWRPRFAG